MFDYYNDVKNEIVIGKITNSFVYTTQFWYVTYTIEYCPYNLIFTKNFLVCDHTQPATIKYPPSFWEEHIKAENDWPFEQFKKYILDGTVNEGGGESIASERVNKIDAKFEYGKIKKVSFDRIQSNSMHDVLLNNYPPINYIRLKLDFGLMSNLAGGGNFIFSEKLKDKAIELLKKTPLANKIQ